MKKISSRIGGFLHPGASIRREDEFDIHDVLTFHPTQLNIPFELNKENHPCSIQLTNKTDRIVAYHLASSVGIQLVTPDEGTYVGTILPRSTSRVTVKLAFILWDLREDEEWIEIGLYVVKDGVEAEDITCRKDINKLTDKKKRGRFRMPVVYYYTLQDLSNIVSFTSTDIERATDGLSKSSKIGKWRYGTVYKGYLGNTEVFIKMLDTELYQGIRDFVQELKVLKEISHPNLVRLVGACIESRTVVYELLPDTSLEDCLDENPPQILTWQNRSRIISQLCSALTFLYSNKPRPILHGNVNPSSIFLDANMDIKVFPPGRKPATNPEPIGKFTECIETGCLKLGSDAYSFGVTLLRILTGLAASDVEKHVDDACEEGWLKRNVDDTTGSWPFQMVKGLAYFGSKFCNISKSASGPVDEILKDLGIISTLIENYGTISFDDNYKDNNEVDDLRNQQGVEEEFSQDVNSGGGGSGGSGSSSHGITKPPKESKIKFGTIDFPDDLIVHPTQLNIPSDFNEEDYYSCSIQLTNKTERIVAYFFSSPWSRLLESPDQDTYVGTILPRSTSSVTVKLGKKPPPEDKQWFDKQWFFIWAYVAKDGVKAEGITGWKNLNVLTYEGQGGRPFRMPVVYYYTVPTAGANSSSAVVPEKNEKRISLLNDDNNSKRVENSPPPAKTGGYESTSRKKSEDKPSFKTFSPKEIEDATNNFNESLMIGQGGYESLMIGQGGYESTSRKKSEDKPSFKTFPPKEIEDATNNFNESLMIGQGGYGKVYKCKLDNRNVAVKILDDRSNQGEKEYIKEMEVLEAMRHENLIHLMGTCFKFRALVYEHLPNGSLEDCLKDRPGELTWEIRTRILYEICTALRFLHANKPEPLVHGDIKPHNVLLGANFKAKLADFGLCRYLTQGENSKAFHDTLNVSGSAGYMDPDFLGSGKVTSGVDVYSFGKTVVKVLTGQHPPDIFKEVHKAKRRGSFMDIVDPTVRDWPENVVGILAHFTLRSTKSDRNDSEFMENFHSSLEKIIDGINN